MTRGKFEIKPVRHYQAARYPSGQAPDTGPEDGEPTFDFWKFVFCLVLVMGLSLGLLCCVDYRSAQCPEGSNLIDGRCVGPDDDCEPGLMRCDTDALMVCDEDGEGWTGQNCEAYCQEMYGFDAYSTGCEADAQDPCQCQYDLTPGVMAECSPGEIQCPDEDTVKICEDSWSFNTFDCQEWCEANFGAEYVSETCDATQVENPCGCQYKIVDGEPVP